MCYYDAFYNKIVLLPRKKDPEAVTVAEVSLVQCFNVTKSSCACVCVCICVGEARVIYLHQNV